MSNSTLSEIQKLIDSGAGDASRLEHIKNSLKNEKPLYNSDRKYLDALLDKHSESEQAIKEEEKIEQKLPEEKKAETRQDSKKQDKGLEEQLQDAQREIEDLQRRALLQEKNESPNLQYKSEGVALVLSIVLGLFGLMGMGHLYAGKITTGVTVLIGSILLLVFLGGTISFGTSMRSEGTAIIFGAAMAFGIIYLVMFIWQIFDSRDLCRKYNQHLREVGKQPW